MKFATFGVMTAIAAALVAAPALAAPPKPKPINYDARAKACDGALKGQYTADGRIHARGFCLSNIPHDSYRSWK